MESLMLGYFSADIICYEKGTVSVLSLGTDNIQGQTSEAISRQMEASGLAGHIQLRDALRKISCKRKYLMDY